MKKILKTTILTVFLILIMPAENEAQHPEGLDHEGYYFSKEIMGEFDQIVDRVIAMFKEEQFGVVSELNMDETLNNKLGTQLKRYKILGMCNPGYAYKAMQAEPDIGLMLPCKVLIREMDGETCVVSAIDPESTMKTINNPELDQIAKKVSEHFKRAMEKL